MYRNTRGEGFGAECKRRIMLGTYVLSAGYYDAYYLKAQKVRTLIARDFSEAFDEVDALIAPVSPFPAFKLGEKIDDPLAMYLSDIYTITGDLAGIPCMSVPCGKTPEGLPVGMQILANHFDEAGYVPPGRRVRKRSRFRRLGGRDSLACIFFLQNSSTWRRPRCQINSKPRNTIRSCGTWTGSPPVP